MTRENIEVISASIAAYNADDLDAQMDTYAPDAVVVPDSDAAHALPGGTTVIVGRDALRNWVREDKAAWRARYQVSEMRAVGADRVLCRGEWGGVGLKSEIEAYQGTSVLFTLPDGVITRAEFYRDHAEARKAAGLE